MRKPPILLRFVLITLIFLMSQLAFCAQSAAPISNTEVTHQLERLAGRLDDVHQQNARNSRILITQSMMIDALQSNQASLMQQLLEERKRVRDTQTRLDAIEADSRQAAAGGLAATTFNIVGMILGIFGGILLAGAQLAARQERIATLHATRPLVDLTLHDTQHEPVLNFFGLLGSIAIASGFVLQFIGALVTSPLPIAVLIIAGMGALLFVVLLVSFFLGYTPDQTRTEKIAIILHNLKRHIAQPVWRRITRQRSVTCQVCLRKLTSEDVEVWWLYEEEAQRFPYLHSPYNFNYGHNGCLPKSRDFAAYFDVPGKYKELRLGQASGRDFLDKNAPAFRAWYVEYHKHWSTVRGEPSQETAFEEQLNRVADDISRLLTPEGGPSPA